MMTPRRPEDDTLPEIAYQLWMGDARQNLHDTARRLEISHNTVESWAKRYHWRQRAADHDASLSQSMRAWSQRALLQGVPGAVQIMLAAGACTPTACYCGLGAPSHPRPDPEERRAAERVLAYAGTVPHRAPLTVDVRQSAPLAVDRARIQAAVASQDNAFLLALLSGRVSELPPLPDTPLPGDFASEQPGGRVAPGPIAPRESESETLDAEFRDVRGQTTG